MLEHYCCLPRRKQIPWTGPANMGHGSADGVKHARSDFYS